MEAHSPREWEECSLRSGVTVASTQPCGQGLGRVQVCHYHANVVTRRFLPPLPALAGAGRVSLGLEGLPLAHLLLTGAQPRCLYMERVGLGELRPRVPACVNTGSR